ncbi:MAG: pyridoxamine 5'-phosphate oxidase family protein [Gammaproteobacteria bacterium]
MHEPDFYDDLALTLNAACRLLERGVSNRRLLAHTPTVATIGADGHPRVRTVVLRGCDRERRQLRFHTDRRSAKLAEIAAEPAVALHVYEPREKMQLRLAGRASVHLDDDAADERWAATRPGSRVCYQVRPAPGSEVTDPAAVPFDAAASDDGRRHFAVVTVELATLEYLYLAAGGHRRARFDLANGDQGTWLVP